MEHFLDFFTKRIQNINKQVYASIHVNVQVANERHAVDLVPISMKETPNGWSTVGRVNKNW